MEEDVEALLRAAEAANKGEEKKLVSSTPENTILSSMFSMRPL